jgi:AraC-like DNA-binding protein
MKPSVADRIKIPPAFWQGLRRLGIARSDLVRQARLPIKALSDGGSVNTEQFFAVWQALSALSGDPAVGIKLASRLEAAILPPSFLAAYHARDFRDALQRVARFKQLCAPERLLISESGNGCVVELEWLHANGTQPAALVDATLASLLELGRHGTREPLSAFRVELARPRETASSHDAYFGCRVIWNAKRDRLMLRRADLDRPFASYNAELLDMLAPELDRALKNHQHSDSLGEQIKWILRRRLTAGRPDVRSVAQELAMSERSLQRKLTDEGLNFQHLLSETRHQLACEHLADPTLDIVEVGFMLGYEDQNSFYRAFRLWENQTPSAWRVARLRHDAR